MTNSTKHTDAWTSSARGHLGSARRELAAAASLKTPLAEQRRLLGLAEMNAGLAASYARSAGQGDLERDAADLRALALEADAALGSL